MRKRGCGISSFWRRSQELIDCPHEGAGWAQRRRFRTAARAEKALPSMGRDEFSTRNSSDDERYVFMMNDEMNELCFGNMRDIFDGDVTDILSCRSALYSVSRQWMKEEPIRTSVEAFEPVDGAHRYTVTSGGVDFELLHLPKKRKKLYVSFVGGTDNGEKRRYPTFLRWKYSAFLDGDYLGIDDPMFEGFTGHGVMWYYGTETVSYLRLLVPVISGFMRKRGIAPEHVTFLGSSGGGTAALYMAELMDGTTAFAMNPQYDLENWKPFVTEYFDRALGIDLSAEDALGRNHIRLTNTRSLFFITENMASPNDRRQYGAFFDRQDLPVKYGVADHGNIVTWLYHARSNTPHSALPDKVELAVLEFLRDEKRRGKNVDEFRPFSYLLGEQLSKRYELETKISDLEGCAAGLMELLSFGICRRTDLFAVRKTPTFVDLAIPGVEGIYYRVEGRMSKFAFRLMTETGGAHEHFISSLCVPGAEVQKSRETCCLRILFSVQKYEEMCCGFVRETEPAVRKYMSGGRSGDEA